MIIFSPKSNLKTNFNLKSKINFFKLKFKKLKSIELPAKSKHPVYFNPRVECSLFTQENHAQ